MKKISLILCLFAVTAFCQDLVWQVNYGKAMQYMSLGKYEDAIAYLKMAVADKPISEIVDQKTGPIEYLPYLQLGIAHYKVGKIQLATEFLDLESSLTAIQKSKTGMALLRDYKEVTAKRQKAQPNDDPEQGIRTFNKKAYVLPEEEVQRMKEDIRQRCNLPRADEHTYPWYYHYELGLGLKQKNDWQRALDSFISALDFRDRPQRFSRIYGMWFIDYYPYYNIGLAHYHLQNWKCAEDSFRLSQMLEDLPTNSTDFKNMMQMKSEAESHLKDTQ
jgi:tetratricopeptide (TPR) repeat protein